MEGIRKTGGGFQKGEAKEKTISTLFILVPFFRSSVPLKLQNLGEKSEGKEGAQERSKKRRVRGAVSETNRSFIDYLPLPLGRMRWRKFGE